MTVSKEKKKYEEDFDPSRDPAYQAALQAVEKQKARRPVYENPYTDQARSLYDRLGSREEFTFDVNEDALYRQYQQQYLRQGRRAMEDTMGRAQAMTGGYGSSYAQSAGQQAYAGYAEKLSAAIPQLYAQALERYQAEGDALLQQYQLAKGQEEQAYQRHKDALDAHRKDVAALQTQADKAYDRSYSQYLQGYQMAGDSYSRLLYLMEHLGYRPTREELLAAGFTQAQAQHYA